MYISKTLKSQSGGFLLNRGTPESSILVGFSHMNHPAIGYILILWKPSYAIISPLYPMIWPSSHKISRSFQRFWGTPMAIEPPRMERSNISDQPRCFAGGGSQQSSKGSGPGSPRSSVDIRDHWRHLRQGWQQLGHEKNHRSYDGLLWGLYYLVSRGIVIWL